MKIASNLDAPNINQQNFGKFNKSQMRLWRLYNEIPEYVNASYTGYTGVKGCNFPIHKTHSESFMYRTPDITKELTTFEEGVLQEIKDTRKKPFGLIRVLWKMAKNFGTADPWDTKFQPEFPGRDKNGAVQYARYKGEILSGNSVSNLFFGHVCAFVGIPVKLAKLIAKLDASGIIEPFTKGHFPNKALRNFRDPISDQLAIEKGMQEFDVNNYRLR